MPRSSLSVLLALTLIGCSRPPELVSVDFDRVAVARLSTDTSSVSAPKLQGLPGGTAQIPAARGRIVRNKSALERLRLARLALLEDRRRAYERLLSNFRREKLAEADRIERELREALEPVGRQVFDEAFARARQVFERFALPLGGARLELARLVGYPDPDPNSRREAPEEDQHGRHRLARAAELRTEIASLTASRDKEIGVLIAEAQANLDERSAEIMRRMVAVRDTAEQEAIAEASRVLQEASTALPNIVPGETPDLPPAPAVTQRISPMSPPRPPAFRTAPADDAEQRRILLAEATIWARTSGYRLVSPAPLARDGTEEFIRWRLSLRPGR